MLRERLVSAQRAASGPLRAWCARPPPSAALVPACLFWFVNSVVREVKADTWRPGTGRSLPEAPRTGWARQCAGVGAEECPPAVTRYLA